VRKVLALLVFSLVMGAPTVARAQYTGDQELGKNWEVRAGIFVPEKKVSRSKGGDVWLALGAERAFYETEYYRATVSIEYYGAEDIYSVPICLNIRATTEQGFRYGAGAGLSLGHDVEKGMNAFAYNALIGYELRAGENPVTIDIRYTGTCASRQELNGWSLVVGYRF
jgi:hypothetical protein